jgi:hypothetical protein
MIGQQLNVFARILDLAPLSLLAWTEIPDAIRPPANCLKRLQLLAKDGRSRLLFLTKTIGNRDRLGGRPHASGKTSLTADQ